MKLLICEVILGFDDILDVFDEGCFLMVLIKRDVIFFWFLGWKWI